MNEIVSPIGYRRLRAPREDGAALFDPPLSDEAAFLHQNIARREQADCQLCGIGLRQLRQQSRRLLLSQARAYTQRYRTLPDSPLDELTPIILAGHQPELVHPGVWFKNFALSRLACRTGSHAVSLLIDNDSMRSTSIRVPGGSVDDPVISAVPFDQPGESVPYEERQVRDATLFASFARRVHKTIRPLVPDPLIDQLWPAAVEAVREQGNLGRALAQARHTLEGTWGLATLELPLSHVCDARPFRWFAAHLISSAERLREVHNECLAEYRRVNRVRSHTHPVPDLSRRGDWTEIPFWLWTLESPLRQPAFVRRNRSSIELSDRRDVRIQLDLTTDRDAQRCLQQLDDMHAAGIRLRPRALITTMFARLVLSDIFIHGIGGAKYDQLTDAIIRRFFAIEPPDYLVATATLKLPVPKIAVAPQDVQRVNRSLRELRFHPELYVDSTPATSPLVAEKRRWIDLEVPPHRRRERHEHIERVNRMLYRMLSGQQEQLEQERGTLRSLLRKQAILDSREYAFCLFPDESLRDRLLDLSRQEP